METKIAPAMQVLAKEVKTNIKTLVQDVGEIPKEIFKNAIQNGLHPAGPKYWLYEWTNNNPSEDAEFNLIICLPVATFGVKYENNDFELKALSAYKHVSEMHFGAWENLKKTYGKLMGEIQKQRMVPGNSCREIYINCDFENPENNIPEVQFEIN